MAKKLNNPALDNFRFTGKSSAGLYKGVYFNVHSIQEHEIKALIALGCPFFEAKAKTEKKHPEGKK